ncbi:MAG: heme a synthase [Pseudonocardiales bacterium]|nr:heme a synthase [Pseudonocardiales bacterium]
MGCPTWPQCDPGSLVPVRRDDIPPVIQWIEFGNRLLGTVVLLISVACLIVAWRVPRDRRLLTLAATMPAGAVLQGVIGGLTVLNQLAWWNVMLHFLPSMLLVWFAVQLVAAVSESPHSRHVVVLPWPGRVLVGASVVVLALLLVAGTLVTAAGPQAGDPGTPRLDLAVELLAQVHGALLVAYVAVLVTLGVALWRSAAPRFGPRSFCRRLGAGCRVAR